MVVFTSLGQVIMRGNLPSFRRWPFSIASIILGWSDPRLTKQCVTPALQRASKKANDAVYIAMLLPFNSTWEPNNEYSNTAYENANPHETCDTPYEYAESNECKVRKWTSFDSCINGATTLEPWFLTNTAFHSAWICRSLYPSRIRAGVI